MTATAPVLTLVLACTLCFLWQLAADQAKLARDFAQFRLHVLMLWLASNAGLAIVVIQFQFLDYFGIAVAFIICGTMGMRMIGAYPSMPTAHLFTCFTTQLQHAFTITLT